MNITRLMSKIEDLEIGNLQISGEKDSDKCIELAVFGMAGYEWQSVNEQDADKIIAHLQNVFKRDLANKLIEDHTTLES